ncbi:MAG: hypothetical protein HGA22_13110, partial [Clostridiales bacterium]|nr:hypothetical protein [Clostridiales bacterium]
KQVQFLDRVEIPEEADESLDDGETDNNVFEFKKFFDKYVSNYKNKKNGADNPSDGKQPPVRLQIDETPEDLAFRSNLDKLRSITQKKNIEVMKNGVEYTNEE